MGIDGNLFDRLKQQANHEDIAVDVLVHRYLSYCLKHSYKVRNELFKPVTKPNEVHTYE